MYKSILDNIEQGTTPKPVMRPITIINSDGSVRIIYVSDNKRTAT